MRLSDAIFRGDLQRELVLTKPFEPAHLALLIGFPVLLLSVSWLVRYLTLLIFHEKRFQLSLRRVTSPSTSR